MTDPAYNIVRTTVAVIIIAAIAATLFALVSGAHSLVEMFAAIPQLTLERLI